MKSFRSYVRLSMLLLALPLSAMASDGWYASVDPGQSQFTGLQNSDGPFVPVKTFPGLHERVFGYRFAAGYRFNQYFGVEAGYVDLGKADKSGVVILCVDPMGCAPVPFDFTVKTHGYVAEATGNWPLGDAWSLYGRVGGFASHSEVQTNLFLGNARSASDTTLVYGAGVAWSFSERLALRFSYDRYGNLGDTGSTGKFGVNLASLGLVYSFH